MIGLALTIFGLAVRARRGPGAPVLPAPTLDFSQSANSQYAALVSVGGI